MKIRVSLLGLSTIILAGNYAIVSSTDNRLTPAQQTTAIEAALPAQGFEAAVKEHP
jgi:hypothetical protein